MGPKLWHSALSYSRVSGCKKGLTKFIIYFILAKWRQKIFYCMPSCDSVGGSFDGNCIHLMLSSWLQITLNQEHKYMLGFAPDYDHLPLIAKVEVFEYALHNTEGNDLARVCILMELWYIVLCVTHSSFTGDALFQGIIICVFSGSLVKKSHLRGMVREENKLYQKLSSHEHGKCLLLISSFSHVCEVGNLYSFTLATSPLNNMNPIQ